MPRIRLTFIHGGKITTNKPVVAQRTKWLQMEPSRTSARLCEWLQLRALGQLLVKRDEFAQLESGSVIVSAKNGRKLYRPEHAVMITADKLAQRLKIGHGWQI